MKEYAKKWAEKVLEDYMKTEQYQKEKAEIEKEFKNFIIYGTPTTWFDDEVLQEIKTEYLDVETIIERYPLTDKEIEDLRKLL
jgi:hypothetical protein